MPYREIIVGGVRIFETLTNHLTLYSMVSMRKENRGIDSANFLSWANLFIQYVRPLTTGDRKILLTHDGYRDCRFLACYDKMVTE